MKRKLITALVLMALGAGSPRLCDEMTAWWNAPPTPPREEAQRLIASLEASSGWKATKCHVFLGGDQPVLQHGDAKVVLRTWHANLEVGGVNINDSFTLAERRAIQRAGESCLRKLTARALTAAE